MHHDFFAWVRLLLLIVLILAFVVWVNAVEPYIDQPEQQEPKEPIYIAQAVSITPDNETAPAPTALTLIEEEPTPATEPATIATEPPTEPIPTETWESLGIYELTAYCSCSACCGSFGEDRPTDQNGNPIVYTATGAIAQAGTTIAVDPSVIPYGSEIQIYGHTYIAQDTGGAIKGNRIDVYFADHQEALVFGRQWTEIFIKTTSA